MRDSIARRSVSLALAATLALLASAPDAQTAQEAYLKASNTEELDFFGLDSAISGDTLVVPAAFEDSSASGVNGDQSDNGTTNSGAAYVFVRNGSTWSQQAYLKASNPGDSDIFGGSVAISGDTIVVGAPGEDSGATGVNGDQSNDDVSGAGAAYVFVRNGTTWSQQAYLKASNTGAGDNFGRSVGISGDMIVVGANREASNATGVGGDQGNDLAALSGAAYVFTRSGTTWSQQAYLKASNTNSGDFFGGDVGIQGDTLVVGARLESSAAVGVGGDQDDNSAPDAGAAYVFVRDGATWSQEAYLKASNTGADDDFGWRVAVSGDTVVVGAGKEDSAATGVNGDQSNDDADGSGAAYVFTRTGNTWSQQAYVKASNTEESDNFTWLDLSGDTLVVGAEGEDSSAMGVNGDQSDNGSRSSGAAYVFTRSGTAWSQVAYLKASNTDVTDNFGGSPAIDGDTIVFTAAGEDSSATGVNGDQNDNSAPLAGAAYVFRLEAPECFLVLGSSPVPGTFTDIGHTWETSVSGITASYPVLLDDIPSFPVPATGSRKARHTQTPPTAIGEVFAQVLMWNPTEFPNNPEQWSEGLRATLWSDGSVTAAPYDTQNGITIRMETWREGSQRYVRFPFSIDGF